MIPESWRPLAWGGVLAASLGSLFVQLANLKEAAHVPLEEVPEEAALKGNVAKRGEALQGLVATAFEERGLRRNHYVVILGAVLGMLGSAQSVLKVLQPQDSANVASTIYLCAPLVRYFGQLNAYMVWLVFSTILWVLGRYEKGAILYVDRPKEAHEWGQQGVTRGRVSAKTKKEEYILTAIVHGRGGLKIKHEVAFNLKAYEGEEKDSFKQKNFVEDVQKKLIDSMPWPTKA